MDQSNISPNDEQNDAIPQADKQTERGDKRKRAASESQGAEDQTDYQDVVSLYNRQRTNSEESQSSQDA